MTLSAIYRLLISILLLGLIPTSSLSFTLDLFKSVDDPIGFQTVQDALEDGVSISDKDGSTSSPLNGVIGGERIIEVELLEKETTSPFARTLFFVDTTQKLASLSSDDFITPRAKITWNGDFDLDGMDDGIPGIDLTAGGIDQSLNLNINTNDNGVRLTFKVTDINDDVAILTKNVIPGTTEDIVFFYGGFTNEATGMPISYDFFEQAKSIELTTSNEPSSLELSFNFLETSELIPFEFSPSLGIIASLSFFAFYRWQKRSYK